MATTIKTGNDQARFEHFQRSGSFQRSAREALRKPPSQLSAELGSPVRPPSLGRTPGSRRLLFGWLGQSTQRQQAGGAPVDTVRKLVNRITQGFQLSEYQRARQMGYQAYLEEQLDHLSIDDSELDAKLAGYTTLSMSPKELVDNYAESIEIPLYELKGAMVLRSVHSKRQLFERMCEFWTDHFNIDHLKDPVWALKSEDDRTVVREHALGTFPDLLEASAHSGAMMYYLDNWLNFAGLPQENYARELMELHTLGVNGGFTEDDVKEVAKALTGWSLNLDPDSPDYLRFQFIKPYHQVGIKTVLGQTIPAFSYKAGGNMVLDILGSHPSTANFIATKLTKWFLSESPPQAVIDEVAATFLATGGDIKAMLRVILREENLAQASPVHAPKFKRPFHFTTSLLRGLEADVTDPLVTVYLLQVMGQSPYDWPPPNGYPDSVNAWGGSLLNRWNFASVLLLNYVSGVQIPVARVRTLLGGLHPNGLAKRMNKRIFGDALSASQVREVQAYIDSQAQPLRWREAYEAIGLAACTPGNQWY